MTINNAVGNVERITPAIAKHILANNINNRNVSRLTVKKYAQEMKSGNWQLNYEPVVISNTGKLLNGQHRLMAIVQSGVAVDLYVIRGADDNITIYDRGYLRKEDQVIAMMGVTNSTKGTVAIAKSFYKYLFPVSSGAVPTVGIVAFLKAYMDKLDEYNSSKGGIKANTPMYVKVDNAIFGTAFVIARDNGMSVEELRTFLKVVKTGYMEEKNQSAAITIRNMCINGDIRMSGDRSPCIRVVLYGMEDFHHLVERSIKYKSSGKRKCWLDNERYKALASTWLNMQIEGVL